MTDYEDRQNRGARGEAILLVDDEITVLESLATTLESEGLSNTLQCHDGRDVMPLLQEASVAVILLDLTMPHVDGRDLLQEIRGIYPEIPVIVVTGTNQVATAVECMRAGAFDYMVKAVEPSRLISGVRRALEIRALKHQLEDLQSTFLSDHLRCPEAFQDLKTRDEKMRRCFLLAENLSLSAEPVLIQGETGVGKNLLAEAIHRASGRNGRFVELNVAALSDEMFADTLFGHSKGAFTGAETARPGMIVQAEGGTILLDEIADLTIPCQVKLLQFLDKGEYFPVGSDLAKRSDARVIVATNRDLEPLMKAGQFRKDLYYRFGTHTISVPLLRERTADIPLLLEHFLAEAADQRGVPVPEIPPEELNRLMSRPFEGNVRELRSIAYDAISRLSGNAVSFPLAGKDQRPRPAGEPRETQSSCSMIFPETLPTLKCVRDQLYEEALRRTNNNQSAAADLLGLSHTAVNNWIKRRSQNGQP